MSLTHGIRRRSDGTLRVRLSEREHQLLVSLPAQLRPLLTDADAAPDIRARLFPRVYEDPMEELERQEEDDLDLASERLTAVDTFAATLDEGSWGRLGWTAVLTSEKADAWLSAINDARLALGTLLGVTTESEWDEGPDPDEPASVALWYLGWLEEQLVRTLMAGLPDPAGEPPSPPTME